MKIAITAENSNGMESIVAQHFGHAPHFIMVTVENGEVKYVANIANPFSSGHQPGEIPGFIRSLGATVILSGGMGGRAIEFFEQAGISVATGARGSVKQALQTYLDGQLSSAAPCDESVAHGHG